MEEQPMDNDDEAGSGSEDEDDGEKEQIIVKATQESVKLTLALLEMQHAKDPNIHPKLNESY